MLLAASVLSGCDDSNSVQGDSITLHAFIRTTDLADHEKSIFRTGEEFIISCYYRNTTPSELSCEYSGPRIQYEILLGDSSVSTFYDSWPLIMSYDTVAVGEKIGETWVAPTNYERDPMTVLRPGIYTIRARWMPDCTPTQLSWPVTKTISVTQ